MKNCTSENATSKCEKQIKDNITQEDHQHYNSLASNMNYCILLNNKCYIISSWTPCRVLATLSINGFDGYKEGEMEENTIYRYLQKGEKIIGKYAMLAVSLNNVFILLIRQDSLACIGIMHTRQMNPQPALSPDGTYCSSWEYLTAKNSN